MSVELSSKTEISLGSGPLYNAAQELLTAAQEYWKVYKQCVGNDAVVYIKGNQGEVVIFSRGEYTTQLMDNIENVRAEEKF